LLGQIDRKREVFDCRYLTSTTGSNTLHSNTDILFLTKLQKSQIPEKGFAQIKKRYHNLNLIPATERFIAESTSLRLKILKRSPNQPPAIG